MLVLGLVLGSASAWGATDARALFLRFECHRCHDGTGLAESATDQHCVRCHREIAAGTFDAERSLLLEWQRNLVSLPAVPSLVGSARLKQSWIERYLLAPHDLRPNLLATMPRLPLGPEDARTIAAALSPDRPARPARVFSKEEARAGGALFESLGCRSCHRFSGGAAAPTATESASAAQGDARWLAPDLAFTRDRMTADAVIAWLRDPKAIKPDTAMPSLGLDETRAAELAAFLLETPLPHAVRAAPAKRPLLARRVRYAEVSQRVFRKLCWHCHSAPLRGSGDGGPGNTGGFGYAGRGVDLSSYEGIARGTLGADGHRRSLFAPLPDGTPLLVATLLARHQEEQGSQDPQLVGMPLGLPALPMEDIQLVETWIAQGRRR
ncbi:MAG: c-type cytochrome [Deltaproteobacteria bacterium]|nr:c-type cytochrome [Deltaproteobacteria bacterium]